MADLLVAFPKVNFQVVEGSGPSGYKAVVEGISGLIAYWRLGELAGTTLVDETVNDRDGTYVGTVAFQPTGLPADSDGSVDFLGTGHAVVPHGAGLSIPSVSISAWFRARSLPVGESGAFMGIVSKDQSGLITSDFTTLIDDEQQLLVQFQNASGSHRTPIIPPISPDTTYHLCVRANASGFDAYLNGQYLGHQPAYTQGWELNTNAIEIGRSPTSGVIQFDGVIDEVAIYNRFITEQEVLALAQATDPPIAFPDTALVIESTTGVIDVTGNDQFVGEKGNLTVQIVAQGSHGTATVRGDNDIDFAAGAVAASQADSFTYQITDTNGASNVASCSVTVQDNAAPNPGGGDLVYEWNPSANGGSSWISGVSLANRDQDNVLGPGQTTQPSPNRWVQGATTGGALLKKVGRKTNFSQNSVCWNFAPRNPPGSMFNAGVDIPCLEMFAETNDHTVLDAYLQLWNEFASVPRHVRVVMELKTSRTSDDTTNKSTGLGPTGGTYPSYQASYNFPGSQAHQKYFCCLYSGNEPGGPVNVNWWDEFATHPITRCGWMIQCGAGGQQIAAYISNYDRPGEGGGSNQNDAVETNDRLSDPGVNGYWHRLENEVFVTDPGTVPANAVHGNGIRPSLTGNGFVKTYLTKDIDGVLGAPGPRILTNHVAGIIMHPRNNNRHITMNIGGPWINWHYGGTGDAVGPAYAWIRRIQVFVHD